MRASGCGGRCSPRRGAGHAALCITLDATTDNYKAKLERAHTELQALADEHVDHSLGMGHDTPVAELDGLRNASQMLWDEDPQLASFAAQYRDLPLDDVVRSVFSMGVLVGWRAGRTEDS